MRTNKQSVSDPQLAQIQAAAEKVVELAGGPTSLSQKLGVSLPNISNWKKRGIPYQQCAAIESLLNGQITCEEMRPDVNWPIRQASA